MLLLDAYEAPTHSDHASVTASGIHYVRTSGSTDPEPRRQQIDFEFGTDILRRAFLRLAAVVDRGLRELLAEAGLAPEVWEARRAPAR
jgi:hypothetical protein